MIYLKRLLYLILAPIIYIFGFSLLPLSILLSPIYYCFNYIINGSDARFDELVDLVFLLLDPVFNFIKKIEPK